jgi:hypothetical protein
MTQTQLDSIDIILSNLKQDKNFYNHGVSQEEYDRIETRREV